MENYFYGNGVVYIGSQNGKLYAFNALTGATIWTYTTGNTIASSPTIADGIVYIGSFDNNLYALDVKTGVRLWNYTANDSFDSSSLSEKPLAHP